MEWRHYMKKRLFASAAIWALLSPANASAEGDRLAELERLMNAQVAQIEIMRAEISALKAEQKSTANTKARGHVSKFGAAPSFASNDGTFVFKPRGRLFIDYWNSNDDRSRNSDYDATEVRTARLGGEGEIKGVKYKMEAEFEENGMTGLTDAYIQIKAFKPLVFTIGQQKTGNSLEELTSSRHITFMERGGLTDAFSFSRQIGVKVSRDAKQWGAAVGVFRGAFGDNTPDEEATVAGRGYLHGKVANEKGLFHMGSSFRYRDFEKSSRTARYRQRPHSHIQTRYVDTGALAADSDMFLGIEGALVVGPFSSQAEWGYQSVDVIGGGNPDFQAGYVDVSYFLTGESRTYKKGTFQRPKVNNPVGQGGLGAWQVAFRTDLVDLNDGGARGGKQISYTVGVNWHLNRWSRIMLNYAHSNIKDSEAGAALLTDGSGNNRINSFGLRSQFDF
jgi:phosphate-selective porin OprO and OprP